MILYDRFNQALGTLAGQAALGAMGQYPGSLLTDFRVLKAEFFRHIRGLTANEGVIFSMCSGELTAAEIAEALLATPFAENETPAIERVFRPVYPSKTIYNAASGAQLSLDGVLTPRWTFRKSNAFDYFIFNHDTAALTTGAVTDGLVKLYGVWVK